MNEWLAERRWMILAWFGCMAISRGFGGYQYGWAFLDAVALLVLGRDLYRGSIQSN